MTLELDHLFICTQINAPEGDRLVSFGLTEGSSNIHTGQGTANRRFFFHNCMLELLWVRDPVEVQSEITRPMHLWERWRDRAKGACPFGFCFRPAANTTGVLPFATWNYRPAYLPDSLSIPVASNAEVLTEPMLFYLPFRKRQDSYSEDKREPLHHAAGLTEITRTTLVSPHVDSLSPELQAAIASNLIDLRSGETYRLELGFDGEKQGKFADFQPELPLILSW
jgi:hypothetical protein